MNHGHHPTNHHPTDSRTQAIAECETKSAAANETLAVGSYKERCDKADVIRVSNDQRRALVRSLGLGLGEKLARGEAARYLGLKAS